jgi:hypothetical protein
MTMITDRPPELSNGMYVLIEEHDRKHRVLTYLGRNTDKAVEGMNYYLEHNRRSRPDVWLAQIVATTEYEAPTISTLAHERMV